MSQVTLKSNFSLIARSLDDEVDPALEAGAKRVASMASADAPRGPTGDLAEGYEAKKVPGGWAVMALWRYFFSEFGTVNTSPQPHLMPAAEWVRANIDSLGKEALRDLGRRGVRR